MQILVQMAFAGWCLQTGPSAALHWQVGEQRCGGSCGFEGQRRLPSPAQSDSVHRHEMNQEGENRHRGFLQLPLLPQLCPLVDCCAVANATGHHRASLLTLLLCCGLPFALPQWPGQERR